MEESLNLCLWLEKEFGCRRADIRSYSPLALAFVGDAVYELVVRTVVTARGNRPVNSLHRMAVRYVNAGAQAALGESLGGCLTEEEQEVYKRGKNAKPYTKAKNASMKEYRTATGLEALVGYLYLKGELPRAVELIKIGLHNIGIE